RHTISYGDWSSDVCSSDLRTLRRTAYGGGLRGGQDASPFVRKRMRAASEITWSAAACMKSANWISATGRRPRIAIPTASPAIPRDRKSGEEGKSVEQSGGR